MAPSFVSNSLPDASEILAIAIQTLIQSAQKTSPSEAVVECAQILKAAQQSPFGGKIPDIDNAATANKIQVLAFNAGKTNSLLSEMVAVITNASRHFGTFCDQYAEITEGLQRQGSGTAGVQLYLELEIVDSRAVRPTAVLTTATATVPGPTSPLPAVASALAGSSVASVGVPVTRGLGGVSASLPPASVSCSVPLDDVFGILSTGLPSISIPRGLTSSNNASFHGSKASYDGDAHVRVPVHPTAEEASTISDDNDESTHSYSSSDSIGDISDESSSSSMASDQWSPCWHAAGIDISPPRRYRYRGLLPTVVGRHFSPMKVVARTTSAISVQNMNRSQGWESFPSFVIGKIEPRPASNNKVPQYKAIKLDASASEDDNRSFYGYEASYDGDYHVDVPTQPTAEEALTIGDIDDELTDSYSCSDSMSVYFTPVDRAAQPVADEHSAVDSTDGESRESCSSSDYMAMSFKPFHGVARPACEDVSDTIGDISDGSMDSSWSITSVEWSPCLHAAGIDTSPPWRYRYQGLLPTVIGRHFSPMKVVARTNSAVPVRTTSPAGESRGLESFPSFVIGEIQPRPAGKKNKVPRYKVVEPIVAPSCLHRRHEALDQSPGQRLQVLCQAESNPCADNPSPLKAPHRSASTKRKLLVFGSRHQNHPCSMASPLRRNLVPDSSSSFTLALDSRLRSPRYLPLRNAACPRRLALD